MWRLTNIEAKNICAFHGFKYDITPECATLIFGDNRDDDSQNSNGSGKSALIEAIAIAITGETLRKVNMDEIINDEFDDAEIKAVFDNKAENIRMMVRRIISRKKPQIIEITEFRDGADSQITAASVADYNKYVLNALGLTKDSIFYNYILTAKKYCSFLACSDKEKKELINHFSNGVLVDQSIEALAEDIEKARNNCTDISLKKAECIGRIDALNTEIENEKEAEINRSADKKQRIKEWKESIAEKNCLIRDLNKQADDNDDYLDSLYKADTELQKLEGNKKLAMKEQYEEICKMFDELSINPISDYPSKIKELKDELLENTDKLKDLDEDHKKLSKKLEKQKKEVEKITAKNNKEIEKLEKKDKDLSEKIKTLRNKVKELSEKDDQLRRDKNNIASSISNLENQIAGVITCPKCGHEFVLNSKINVSETKKEIEAKTDEFEDIKQQIGQVAEEYTKVVESGKFCRNQQLEITENKQSLENELRDISLSVDNIERNIEKVEREIEGLKSKNEQLQERVNRQHKSMFDMAFDNLDATTNTAERKAESIEQKISSSNGAIAMYRESIREAENSAETDVVDRLKKSKVENEKKLKGIEAEEMEAASLYESLNHQEQIFAEFKTYLANAKIEAINEITNSFLEAIGTDIKIHLSGYTMLKSGKIREKISVSLTRDGIDCGSFDKFSRGEQTRVELACILAMHELTNENCQEGKGLDLLVVDEILDATDEQGLTNVFKALNDTHITSLVVSHGNIAENYPHRLIVHKEKGISFID